MTNFFDGYLTKEQFDEMESFFETAKDDLPGISPIRYDSDEHATFYSLVY